MLRLVALFQLVLLLPATAWASSCQAIPASNADLQLRSCRVLRHGQIDRRLTWELQKRVFHRPDEGEGESEMDVIVVTRRGKTVAWSETEEGWLQLPRRVVTRTGEWLLFPVEGAGSAGRTLDVTWLRRPGGSTWQRIDTASWRDALQTRLSLDEVLSPVHRLDLPRMQATGLIMRDNTDAHCCPSGGRYTAFLRLLDTGLVLQRFTRS